MRFVCTSSIGVGVGVWVRRAVAAAAEDRLALEGCDARNACVAAVWADGEGLGFRGYVVEISEVSNPFSCAF